MKQTLRKCGTSMKPNYQLQLDTFIEQIPVGTVPKLLLHSCCGPCSTYVLSYLAKHFEITVFFYNPNIMPSEEYQLRLKTQQTVIENLSFPNKVSLVAPTYDVKEFLSAVKGFENEPERGVRCEKCMELRIRKTAEYAVANDFDFFCTTLSVSPHKDAVLLHDLSQKYAAQLDIPALPADFKKRNGFLESIRLSKELNLYRQNYCGCIFSKAKSDE